MKTEVEREVIPPDPEPTVVERTWYICEDCDFRSQNKEQTKEHQAKEHAVKGKLEAGGKTLYRFESQEAAQAWLDVIYEEWNRVRSLDWDGPGWYTLESWTQPCPRGCCRDSCIRIFPIQTFFTEQTDKAREIMHDVKDIRQAIRELGHG